jgi:outer membrane protein TolC
MRAIYCLLFFVSCGFSEVVRLTLPEAVERASRHSATVGLAELDERQAHQSVLRARDPFVTKLYVGSGIADTIGLPQSVDGGLPAVLLARAVRSIYNRPQQYAVAEARQQARAAGVDTELKRDEAAFAAASAYLDLVAVQRSIRVLEEQQPLLERIAATASALLSEGRALPLEERKARLAIARLRQRVRALETARGDLTAQLAVLVGLGAEDQVTVVEEGSALGAPPESEEEAIDLALRNNKETRRLEALIQAKGLSKKGAGAAWIPQVDLISQYSLLSRLNNFEAVFNRFERHNFQYGVSFKLPVLSGSAIRAQANSADIEMEKLRMQMSLSRNQVALRVKRAYGDWRLAEEGRQLSRLELDAARDEVGVLLAQFEEGRLPLQKLEEARTVENERWLMLFQAQAESGKVKLRLFKETGQLSQMSR